MRFMTYNIRLGIQQGLEPIAAILRSSGAQVIALQEVGNQWGMGPDGDTTAALARLAGFAHSRFIPCIHEGARQYGHALLSAHPLSESALHALPLKEDEPRVLAQTQVQAPGGEVTVLHTHLSWVQDRAAQGRVLAERAAQLASEHVVVMGDLNEAQRPAWMQALLGGLEDADAVLARPTYPAEAPRLRIDYLLSSRGRWEDVQVKTEREASDHLPLLATLML